MFTEFVIIVYCMSSLVTIKLHVEFVFLLCMSSLYVQDKCIPSLSFNFCMSSLLVRSLHIEFVSQICIPSLSLRFLHVEFVNIVFCISSLSPRKLHVEFVASAFSYRVCSPFCIPSL